MPDRLDDYEGFFGLEEVDDVEVVKDASSGKTKFLSKASKSAPTKPERSNANDHVPAGDEPEEWSGFPDEGKAGSNEPAGTKNKKHSVGVQNHANAAKKTKVEAPGGGSVPASAFDILTDDAEDNIADVSAWKDLRLSPDTMASLSRLRFSDPTPIQRAVIPEILAGHDVIGKASTGSGKTLAFGIPVLERFLELRSRASQKNKSDALKAPVALILSPTRELAHQLEKHLKALCTSDNFDAPLIATLTGGLSVQKQQRLLKDADIVVGTPGRLWEVISSGQGTMGALQRVHFLILDEADRLLSDGHFKEVEEILTALDRIVEGEDDHQENGNAEANIKTATSLERSARQTLVFSATFDRGLQRKLASKSRPSSDLMSSKESMDYLLSKLRFHEEKPKYIDVNPVKQLASGLKEGLVECVGTEKDLYLYAVLLLHSNTRALVFTNSIDAVRRITPLLQNLNLSALALHSGMPQKARLRSVERFASDKSDKKSPSSILIATDVAARGLDIANVQLVIHYHLPRAADTYVHRSGRTARAGQPGSSVLLCAPEEVAGVRRLVAKVHAQAAVAHDRDASDAAKQGFYIRTLDIDRRIVARLKPRITLAKKLADTTIAKEKQHKEDDFMRSAAEELGVDYDSEEFEKQSSGRQGRGSGRKKKQREARQMSKAELGAMRAELKDMLKHRVNVGVSERYLTSGSVDVDELLRQQETGGGKTGEFLGHMHDLGLADV